MINIEVKDAEIQKKLESIQKKLENLKPVFGVMGEELLKNHKQRFKDEKSPDGEKWQNLFLRV